MREIVTGLLVVLRDAHADVCSLHCPSVGETGEEWPHSERCKAISTIIAKAEEVLMRKVGDKVFVTADNYGLPGEIIDIREGDFAPPSHYKVRTEDGQEFWAYDFEVGEVAE